MVAITQSQYPDLNRSVVDLQSNSQAPLSSIAIKIEKQSQLIECVLSMTLIMDIERGRTLAPILYYAFADNRIFGRKDMPEDIPPRGVSIGSREHLLFLTLTVSIDYQRDAHALWDSARKTFEDPATRYLFEPETIQHTTFERIRDDFQKYTLSKKPRKDAWIWETIALTLNKKYGNDPRLFFLYCDWDANSILEHLRLDRHPRGKNFTWDFPFLRGQ